MFGAAAKASRIRIIFHETVNKLSRVAYVTPNTFEIVNTIVSELSYPCFEAFSAV